MQEHPRIFFAAAAVLGAQLLYLNHYQAVERQQIWVKIVFLGCLLLVGGIGICLKPSLLQKVGWERRHLWIQAQRIFLLAASVALAVYLVTGVYGVRLWPVF